MSARAAFLKRVIGAIEIQEPASYLRNNLVAWQNRYGSKKLSHRGRKVRRVQRQMKSNEAIGRVAETFKLLGDATRVKIAFALSREELCVCDLANLLGASQSAVSHSLRSLRQLKLVRFRKKGKTTYYALDDDHIANLLNVAFSHVEESV